MKQHYGIPYSRLTIIVLISVLTAGLSACGALTSVADSKQVPSVARYSSTKSADHLFTAAVQSLSGMGQIVSNDRESRVAQGKKGNWVISATINPYSSGSTVAVTARYVPSNRYDFNSRDRLTSEFVTGVERALSSKLTEI